MILRKPYAILIKNFKLIHMILASMMIYIFYRTTLIFNFFNEYLATVAVTINKEVTNSLFGMFPIIISVLIIIGCSVILALMRFKDKPIKFYLYTILVYILFIIFYITCFDTVKTLELSLVDVRTLKVLSDITTFALIVESLGLIIVIIRATGFDIKSFNFKKDLEDLNIDDNDNEEFEINTEIDTNKLKRNFNKQIRHFKYTYVENKLFINIFVVILFAISTTVILVNKNSIYNKHFGIGSTIKTTLFNFEFKDTYYTNKDYNGKILDNDNELVVVRFNAKSLYGDRVLGNGSFYLNIKNYKYYHTIKYKDSLFDFGKTFNGQTVTNVKSDYVLVFKIPKSKINDKMTLIYTDVNNKNVKINIKPKSLDKEEVINNYKVGEKIEFNKSILNNSNIVINSFELAPSFKIDYKYCVGDECIDSYEYLKANSINGTSQLIKINGSYELDESLNIDRINNLYKFIKYFATIKYEKNGVQNTMNTGIFNVISKRTKTLDTYIEITDDVASADKINLEFNIRGKIYIYNLK